METKTCSKCGEIKVVTEFHKKKNGKYGVASWCKNCSFLHAKSKNFSPINDPDIIKTCTNCNIKFPALSINFHKDKKSQSGLRSICKSCHQRQGRSNIKNNVPINDGSINKKCSYCKNFFPATTEFFHKNKNVVSGLYSWCKSCTLYECKEYYENNKEKSFSKEAKRRAIKLQAVAKWANFNNIEKLYEEASFNTRVGVPCHVDHIDPLQSPLVCGLHVENNLRVVEASYNISKNNSFTPYRIDQNGKKYLIKVSDGWRKRCENFCKRLKPL